MCLGVIKYHVLKWIDYRWFTYFVTLCNDIHNKGMMQWQNRKAFMSKMQFQSNFNFI